MPRTLRSRAKRPNYAAMLEYDEDADADEQRPEAGPSGTKADAVSDEDSGSDFAPDVLKSSAIPDDEDDVNEDQLLDEANSSDAGTSSVVGVSVSGISLKRKRRASAHTPNKRLSVPASRTPHPNPNTSTSALAVPSFNHRHRPLPIYLKPGLVERLARAPTLFAREATVLTNGWGADEGVAARVSKAWGYNVGPGPLWELLEDRGWFPEATTSEGVEGETEVSRRPKVYEDVFAGSYEILDPSCVFRPRTCAYMSVLI